MVVVTSKVISRAEGRFVGLAAGRAVAARAASSHGQTAKDPRLVQLILGRVDRGLARGART